MPNGSGEHIMLSLLIAGPSERPALMRCKNSSLLGLV